MVHRMQQIVQQLAADGKRIFLVDGLGAVASVVLIAGVVAPFPELFGMPVPICYILSLVAVLYAVYSLGCYFFVRNGWPFYLNLIITANLFHCLLTVVLLFYYSESIKWPGFVYFILEICVVLIIVRIEWIGVSKTRKNIPG